MQVEGFDDLLEGELRFFRSQGKGPGVMLMHELPGMTPSCIELAKRLSDKGLPHLLAPAVRTAR